MEPDRNMTKESILTIGRESMPEPKLYRPGDVFAMPMAFQLLKVFGQQDRVYYLCAPILNPKRSVCLKDPFFLICLEPNNEGEEAANIPDEVIKRASDFVTLQAGERNEPEDEDESDGEDDASGDGE